MMWLGIGIVALIIIGPAIGHTINSASNLQPRAKELERACNGAGFVAGACLLLLWSTTSPMAQARPYYLGIGVFFMLWGIVFYRTGTKRLAHTPRDPMLIMGSLIYLAVGAGFFYLLAQNLFTPYVQQGLDVLGIFFVVAGIFRILLNRDRTTNTAGKTRTAIEGSRTYGGMDFDDD